MGGVRLTEYEERRGDGFVRRLNNEATSFFFTNIPEDVLVVDLWKVFAKFGRVGEVYIPNKVDRWGRKFGFVKFLEVKNVEELNVKLGEVWCGTFKLRINLARFGRNINQKARGQPSENKVDGPSFKEVLGGGVVLSDKKLKGKEITETAVLKLPNDALLLSSPLQLEPDMEFIYTLESSVVGRLSKGKNIKQIQFNLCMEGYRNIRVANMGEGLVLVFSESGGDVGLAISKKSWWEGLLEDLRPWSPLMVTTKRDVWVRLYGVPLQLWNEQVFGSILKPRGDIVGLDDDTRGRTRFDVARVKLSSPILGSIDFTQEIVSQGISFVVRVVEERGGPLEFIHVSREEDQLGWSAVVSSCDSGERGDRGPEVAMVVGGDFGDSDSDGSEQCKQRESVVLQVAQRCNEVKRNFEILSQ
ncbi:RNA recognition motif, partial [Trifolium medium]|nr:RNA recognition motif [Trifolium medium]